MVLIFSRKFHGTYMKNCFYVKNVTKYKISGKNLKISGKNKKNSEKFGKIQKNSEKFRKIWKNSGKIGEQNIKSGEISGVWKPRARSTRGPREGGRTCGPGGVHTYPTYPQLTARRGCSQKIFQGGV